VWRHPVDDFPLYQILSVLVMGICALGCGAIEEYGSRFGSVNARNELIVGVGTDNWRVMVERLYCWGTAVFLGFRQIGPLEGELGLG